MMKNESLISWVKNASNISVSLREGKEYSDAELSLGFSSFIVWCMFYICGIFTVEYQSRQARETGISFIVSLSEHTNLVNRIKKQFPDFNSAQELYLSDKNIDPVSDNWNEWKLCLTRSLIMITRNLSANMTGNVSGVFTPSGFTPTSKENAFPQELKLEDLITTNFLWLSETFDIEFAKDINDKILMTYLVEAERRNS